MSKEKTNWPYLSIIVPVYKVEKYIRKCIDSILAQTFTNFELILVDDGSPDCCGYICEEYALIDKRIKVIHKENGGLSAARNSGIDIALGEIIAFVDSDDWIHPQMYEKMIKYLNANGVDIVCCDTYIVKNSKTVFKARYNENKILTQTQAVNYILEGAIDNAAWNKIYNKDLFKKIRYPVGRVFEDVATTYRLFAVAEKVGVLKEPLYYYLKRTDSIIGQSFNSRKRMDSFYGFEERLNFAEDNKLAVIASCRANAIAAALSTLTANYIDYGLTRTQFSYITEFINCNRTLVDLRWLKRRNKFLLFAFTKFPLMHKWYADLSCLGKKVKQRFK